MIVENDDSTWGNLVGLSISQLRAIAQQRDRYQTQLTRLKGLGKQTSCIEAAVSSACDTLESGTTSFVIYGEPRHLL
ncbi:hypothetical protein [Bradyrhizobium sp. USDA 336]|uniref:hypothetical protein n=1 Tax=Bradyrhizobium sp. USDA 336 TaxID=3156311 RepID=UPI003836BCD2